MPLFQNATFFTTVNHLRDLPPTSAEIAFVGRSNAGKSSAINALANRTRLAYVSKTPGRTQHINFFRLASHFDYFLVDLPAMAMPKCRNPCGRTGSNCWAATCKRAKA